MLTVHERRAVFIVTQRLGVDNFANMINVNPDKLMRALKGAYEPQVESAIRRNWHIVKEVLFGNDEGTFSGRRQTANR